MLHMDEYEYQLRKIGPKASCERVPKLMRLCLGQTKIGRGQNNDYYLDSAKLKNFISRYHAEVIGKKNENGEIEFTLHDKGLNGTFINDTRTFSTCVLEEGDKITFGHTNGYRIQPGEQATQPNSEFQFLFEKVPKRSMLEILEDEAESSDSNVTDWRDRDNSPGPRSNSNDRACLSANNRSNVLNPATKDSKSIHSTTPNSSNSTSSSKANSKSGKNHFTDSKTGPGKNKLIVKHDEVDGADSSKDSLNNNFNSSSLNNSENMCSETLPALESDLDTSNSLQKSKRGSTTNKKNKGKASASNHDSTNVSDDSSMDATSTHSDTAVKQTASKRGGRGRRRGPGGGGRKRKRKKTNEEESSAEDDELEDGVEWYEEETCDSEECKKPKNKLTPWVQCDDCDQWYHTICVGASYDQVKDSDINFNCGCN